MDTERKGLWFQMAVGIIIVLMTLHLVGISNDYPHYFMADMDWPTSLDAVLIHSDMLPDHINHPGFGMYLMHHSTTRVGYWFGGVSALTLAEGLSTTTKIITLNNGMETIELYGLGMKGYYHVPISRFSKRFFFVIAGVTF